MKIKRNLPKYVYLSRFLFYVFRKIYIKKYKNYKTLRKNYTNTNELISFGFQLVVLTF